MTPTPPTCTQKPHSITLHGIERQDPYHWLKDPNWQEVLKDPSKLDPEIRAHLDAENAYSNANLTHLEALRETLFAEMKGRIKEDDSSVPSPDGSFEYYRRFETGAQYPIYCRRPKGGEEETTLLDVNGLAEGHEFCQVTGVSHSPDHSRLAYAVDFNGSEYYELRVIELSTGELRSDVIPGTSGNFTWAADSQTLFYTVLDDNHRPKWVRRHRLGDAVDAAAEIYEEQNPGFFVHVDETESREFVLIHAHDHTTSETYWIPGHDPTQPPTVIEPRADQVQYEVSHHGEHFYFLLREGRQKDGAILRAPVASAGREQWEPVVAFRAGCLIEDLLMFGDHLVRHEMVDALPRIVIRQMSSGDEHAIDFDEEAFDLGMIPGYEFDTTTLRFNYSSMTTPTRVYDYDMESRERELRKEQEVPSGHDPSGYVVERLTAPARDGESIPLTALRRVDTPTDGSAPVYLYGYGSYGYSIPASFSTQRLSLVDRGVIVVVAHIRGGKEKGYDWYESAKLANKVRTFRDFIDAGEHLVASGWTRRGQIVAHGGSAGGMLMGAIANEAPQLFGGVVADVPFVDVLNTMSDDTLPLTPPEWPEWGNPIESREAYESIASYSPYDNVKAQEYPKMFVLAGLTDPRVTYWEPAKWVARLREVKTDEHPVLLDMEMGAGHMGASGRFDYLKKVAKTYAFVLDTVGKA